MKNLNCIFLYSTFFNSLFSILPSVLNDRSRDGRYLVGFLDEGGDFSVGMISQAEESKPVVGFAIGIFIGIILITTRSPFLVLARYITLSCRSRRTLSIVYGPFFSVFPEDQIISSAE